MKKSKRRVRKVKAWAVTRKPTKYKGAITYARFDGPMAVYFTRKEALENPFLYGPMKKFLVVVPCFITYKF